MPINIGRNKEEQERINTLTDFMGEHITNEIVYTL